MLNSEEVGESPSILFPINGFHIPLQNVTIVASDFVIVFHLVLCVKSDIIIVRGIVPVQAAFGKDYLLSGQSGVG